MHHPESLVAPPGDVASVRWRRVERGDADGIHAIALAAGELDHPYFTIPRDEIIEDVAGITSAGGGDGIVAISDGRIVAYGMVLAYELDSIPRAALLTGAVQPAHRGLGLGCQALTWQRTRGVEWLTSLAPGAPFRLLCFADENARALRSALAETSFEVSREFLHLRRSAMKPLGDVLPTSYSLSRFQDVSSDAVRRLRNAAFADQWAGHSLDSRAWETFIGREIFDADLSRAVLDEHGHVVAYSLVEVDPAEHTTQEPFAYLASLGVDAAHRGRGIGGALLSDLISAARDRGLDEVALDVDGASASRANDLYLRRGFRVAQRRFCYSYNHLG